MGEPQPDDSFFVVMNAGHTAVNWTLPKLSAGSGWQLVTDTDRTEDGVGEAELFEDGDVYETAPRSLLIFIRKDEERTVPALVV
jgi:hypothetical protein